MTERNSPAITLDESPERDTVYPQFIYRIDPSYKAIVDSLEDARKKKDGHAIFWLLFISCLDRLEKAQAAEVKAALAEEHPTILSQLHEDVRETLSDLKEAIDTSAEDTRLEFDASRHTWSDRRTALLYCSLKGFRQRGRPSELPNVYDVLAEFLPPAS
jgi:hypothetical protein